MVLEAQALQLRCTPETRGIAAEGHRVSGPQPRSATKLTRSQFWQAAEPQRVTISRIAQDVHPQPSQAAAVQIREFPASRQALAVGGTVTTRLRVEVADGEIPERQPRHRRHQRHAVVLAMLVEHADPQAANAASERLVREAAWVSTLVELLDFGQG